jgi:hypothetical protein
LTAARGAGGPGGELVAGAIGLGRWLRRLYDGAIAIPDWRLPGGVLFPVAGRGVVERVSDRWGGRGRIVLGRFDVTAAAGGENG